MLLEHKNAIIYGGAGSIGSAVAHTFAREGARVFLAAGRGGGRRAPRHGVRVVTLETGGIPETIAPDFGGIERVTEMPTSATLLGRTTTPDDVGNVAASVASDRARSMTASTVNISGGALIDL